MSKYTKRQWEAIQRRKKKDYKSAKSDNRVYCFEIQRDKYLYENEFKAIVALKFNKEIGAVRYYSCDRCMGYHLTSKTLEQYFQKKSSFQKPSRIG